MKGLLFKDILNLRQQGKVYLVIISIWLVIGIMNQDATFFAGVMMIFSLLVPVSAIAYDERAKWDKFALTMPLSKLDLIASKYLLSLLCAGLSGILAIIVGLAISGDTKEVLMSVSALMSLGVIFTSFILPIIFKFGVEKGRLVVMVLFLAPSVLVMLISKLNLRLPNEEAISRMFYFLPLIAIAILLFSIYLSVLIYSKKEF